MSEGGHWEGEAAGGSPRRLETPAHSQTGTADGATNLETNNAAVTMPPRLTAPNSDGGPSTAARPEGAPSLPCNTPKVFLTCVKPVCTRVVQVFWGRPCIPQS